MILISILLILSGCNNSYSEEDLINDGYKKDDSGNYRLYIGESGDVTILVDESGTEPIGIGAGVYVDEYQYITVYYYFLKDKWEAAYWNGENEVQPIDVNDAYAYMASFEPKIVEELSKIMDSLNIPSDQLEGGDKSDIESLVANDIEISNLKVEGSKNTDESGMNDVGSDEYLLQVNFSLTNISNNAIDVNKFNTELCYSIPTGQECSNDIAHGIDSDTDLYDQTITPGSTVDVQQTMIVENDAYDFYVKISSNEEKVYFESQVVNK